MEAGVGVEVEVGAVVAMAPQRVTRIQLPDPVFNPPFDPLAPTPPHYQARALPRPDSPQWIPGNNTRDIHLFSPRIPITPENQYMVKNQDTRSRT
jgi:hypothetical protein